MGDAGEGWVDAEARIHERMEELERERKAPKGRVIRDPELERSLESLKLARIELERQLNTSQHKGRKAQISQAIDELERRISAIQEQLIS
jgi:hypothetical protein